MNGKRTVLAGAALGLVLCTGAQAQEITNNPAPMPTAPLTASGQAAPERTAAITVSTAPPGSPQSPQSPPGGMAAPVPTPAAAPAAPATVQNPAQTGSTAAVPDPAVPGAAQVPATPVAGQAPAAPVAAAAAPTAAEMAIIQNAPILNPAVPGAQTVSGTGTPAEGMKVTDILSQPALVRPLPQKYLVVKKDRDENATDARLTAARAALWQGRYQAALELFDDLYKRNASDFRIVMGRAVALQKLGQEDEAYAAYGEALAIDPKNIEALTNLMGIVKKHDAATSLAELQSLQSAYPANADIAAQLGMVYGVSGDYEKALKYLDVSDSLKPGNLIVLYNRAVVFDRMGRGLEAADLYRKLLQVSTDAGGQTVGSIPLEAVRRRLAALH